MKEWEVAVVVNAERVVTKQDLLERATQFIFDRFSLNRVIEQGSKFDGCWVICRAVDKRCSNTIFNKVEDAWDFDPKLNPENAYKYVFETIEEALHVALKIELIEEVVGE